MDSPSPPIPPVITAVRCAIRVPFICMVDTSRRASIAKVLSLDCERHTHSATDAQAREAALCVAANHLVQERDQDSASRRADGVTDGNGAPVDIDPRSVPAHFLVDPDGL